MHLALGHVFTHTDLGHLHTVLATPRWEQQLQHSHIQPPKCLHWQESLSSISHQISTPTFPLWHVEKVWEEHSELAFSNLHAWWSPVCCQSLRSSSHLTFCLMLVCVCVSEVQQRHLLFIISEKERERRERVRACEFINRTCGVVLHTNT